MITVQKHAKFNSFNHLPWWFEYGHHNTFRMWTVLYLTRSSRTQFGVSINIWRLVGDTSNITCNFLYCNHQVHRDFLITTYTRAGIAVFKYPKYVFKTEPLHNAPFSYQAHYLYLCTHIVRRCYRILAVREVYFLKISQWSFNRLHTTEEMQGLYGSLWY
jgi:hypothetical protein